MVVTSFLGLSAFSNTQIHDDSTAAKGTGATAENDEKEQNVTDNGIERSHGKNWFRRRKIGQGAGGSVYLADHEIFHGFTSPMAVKSAHMRDSSSIQHEKRVFSILNGSPNLVFCYGDEITETDSGEKVYNLLMEYCSGGTLSDHITQSSNGLPESEVASFAKDIALGLEYMHTNGYAHCDIKTENILLVPDYESSLEKVKYTAKIADFGISLNMFEEDEDGFRVSSEYMAPATVRDVDIVGLSDDVWSYGCTVLEMLTGKLDWGPAFMEKSDREMEYMGCNYAYPKISDRVSEKAKDFLSVCLDPVRRYDRCSMTMLLEHPFLSAIIVGRYQSCRH